MTLVQEKRGGPYTKDEKIKRQNEVFRLHFDLGYSAVRIAEMMNVNRNTISGDINYWYSALSKEWDNHDLESWHMKQTHRLESQRVRLFKELEKAEEISTRLSIEKTILDIDIRLMNSVTKIISFKGQTKSYGIDMINQWAKEKNIDLRVVDASAIWHVSRKTAEKIEKLRDEDWDSNRGKM